MLHSRCCVPLRILYITARVKIAGGSSWSRDLTTFSSKSHICMKKKKIVEKVSVVHGGNTEGAGTDARLRLYPLYVMGVWIVFFFFFRLRWSGDLSQIEVCEVKVSVETLVRAVVGAGWAVVVDRWARLGVGWSVGAGLFLLLTFEGNICLNNCFIRTL